MIPKTWTVAPLRVLVEVLDHMRVPVNGKERATRLGDVPYYGATGQVGWIDDHLFEEELVLLGEDGVQFFDPAAQKAYIIRGKSWVNNHAHVLRPINGLVSADYLCLALNNADYRDYANGTTRLKLTKGAMVDIGIPLPPRREQDRIVGVAARQLGRISTGELGFSAGIRDARAYAEACLGAAFDGVLTGASPITRPLGELAEVQSGLTKGRVVGEALTELPYIRTANVQARYLDLAVIKTIAVSPQQRKRHRLQPLDVLILEGGDADKVGRGWIWNGEIEECLHQNHVFAVRTRGDRLLPRYLAYFVNAPQARRYFLSCAKQTTNLASINKRQLLALPVPHLDLADQQSIVDLLDRQLDVVGNLERALKDQASSAVQMRRVVHRRALNGELVAQDDEDEPVARLLGGLRSDAARSAPMRARGPGRKVKAR